MMATKAKKPKAGEPAQRKPDCLNIDGRYLKEGEKEKYKGATDAEIAAFTEELTARAVTQPEVRAARAIQRYEGDSLDINACADELRQQIAEVQRGEMKRPEAMLVAQAHTLDALFQSLALRSHANSREGYLDAADRYLRLALKAQAQSVRTIEALAELKNPRPVAFVKQANIANGPQQINNGMAAPSHAREINNEQTQLLRADHGERLDTGTTREAIPSYSSLETVGEIDRAEVTRG